MEQEVVSDDFLFNTDRAVVVALPDSVKVLSWQRLVFVSSFASSQSAKSNRGAASYKVLKVEW